MRWAAFICKPHPSLSSRRSFSITFSSGWRRRESTPSPNFNDRPPHRIAFSSRGRSPFPLPARNRGSPQVGARCRTCTNRSLARKWRRQVPSSVAPRIKHLLLTGLAPTPHVRPSTFPNATDDPFLPPAISSSGSAIPRFAGRTPHAPGAFRYRHRT